MITSVIEKKSLDDVVKEVMDRISVCMANPEGSTTAWVNLGFDEKNTYVIAVGYYWYGDEDFEYTDKYTKSGSQLSMKMAYAPKNSVMHEYGMDFCMPVYPGSDDGFIWDTETHIYEGENARIEYLSLVKDVAWLLGEFYSFCELTEKAEMNQTAA